MRWNGVSGRAQPYHGGGPMMPQFGPRGAYFGVLSAQPIHSSKIGLDGLKTPVYGLNFIGLLDHAILSGDIRVLSKKQRAFWSKYAHAADNVTVDTSETVNYGDMDTAFQEFDHFLGTYGVENEYTG